MVQSDWIVQLYTVTNEASLHFCLNEVQLLVEVLRYTMAFMSIFNHYKLAGKKLCTKFSLQWKYFIRV